jgi:hypothetical protein
VDINDRLHDLRQDLNTLREEVGVARSYMPSDLYPLFSKLTYGNPSEVFLEILNESKELEGFLMDTFQLLMSTISVLDSQASIQDARRSARLTQLATIYVPLSFVTGIFGMNVKEINDSALSVWTAAVALVVVVILTAGLLWAMTALPDPTLSNKQKSGKRKRTFRKEIEEG